VLPVLAAVGGILIGDAGRWTRRWDESGCIGGL
jgi:hypothetical protein